MKKLREFFRPLVRVLYALDLRIARWLGTRHSLSGYAYQRLLHGKWAATWFVDRIDGFALFWWSDRDHCHGSYHKEIARIGGEA